MEITLLLLAFKVLLSSPIAQLHHAMPLLSQELMRFDLVSSLRYAPSLSPSARSARSAKSAGDICVPVKRAQDNAQDEFLTCYFVFLIDKSTLITCN
jgi:hypothetical protein